MPTVIPAQFLVLNDFLSAEEREAFFRVVENDANYNPAFVFTPGVLEGKADEGYRKASVVNAEDHVFASLVEKLKQLLPHARREVGVPYFRLGELERQFAVHRKGDFFRRHNDVGDIWNRGASRRLSFVYYFNEHPKAFSGGELRIYDQIQEDDGSVRVADTFQVVEPNDNSIVFFSPFVHHEVTEVIVDGDPTQPGASRCAVTGWFNDRDFVRPAPPLDPPIRTALTQRYTPSFTADGFQKMRTPPSIHRKLRELYDARIEQTFSEQADEVHLPTGTPAFIDIADVRDDIHHAMHSLHEAWCGVELVPTAVYGLRVYREGQTLIPHTDRLETHVISSIVHIAHETTEPWPLWIVDLHGNEHEILLEEGEMILYESARCPHGRPTPLQGSAYCSLFLHYRPLEWNVTPWTLIDQARADGATDVLPKEFWPAAK